ncbi:MAG TPA: tandem-95 repeat protein, partial [Gammaproteobacteria bacterium]|nr:tandem-95 repeat protein [Gammaproteobacteria bacterium]
YTVSDGNGGEIQGTVQIAVNTVNHAPMAAPDSASTTEGSSVTTGNVLVNDSDPDGDSLSISGADSQSAEGGTVVNNGDGTFTYTPPAGFSGADSFTYTVSDGNGAEAQGTVSVTVTKVIPVNNPPVAMADAVTTQQDTSVTTGDVLANDSDPDGDSVTVSGVDSQSAQGGIVVDNGDGTFTYTPASGYVGSDMFNYMISDGKGGQAQGVVNITVEQATSTNTNPVAVDDTAETEVDTAVTVADVLANDSDADGDVLSITSADSVSEQGGSVDNHGDGSFTYTPPAGFNGEDRFHYTISDGNGGEDQATVTITVNKQDDGDGFWLGSFDLWMLLLLLFPLGYRRYQQVAAANRR